MCVIQGWNHLIATWKLIYSVSARGANASCHGIALLLQGTAAVQAGKTAGLHRFIYRLRAYQL